LAGEFARARQLYENILAHNPDEPGPEVLLAELDIRDLRLMSAKARLERVVARHPESIETRAALANVLEDLGDVSATTAFYREETARAPGEIDGWIKYATSLQTAGRIEESLKTFRHVLDQWPQSVAGYHGLSSIDPALLSDDEVDRLRAMASGEERGLDERIHAYFALGRVYEHRRDFDAAFGAFEEGNRLRRENANIYGPLPESLEALPKGAPSFTSVEQAERVHDSFVIETMHMFTPAYLAKFAGSGDPSRAPIFIIGMPRSGSTLLEQILSSHPQVQGLGETQALSRTFRAMLAAAQRDPSIAATFYKRVGTSYLEALRELGWDGRPRVIDKMLGNYINVGTIQLALPNAIVLHSVRDPVDTCLSSFRQLFGRKNETSYDLAAIGRQYRRYREMIAHWDKVLPGRIIHVEHERLIADAEPGIRALVAACGIEWNDACLRYNENERTVRTASVSQVRQPISTAAVQRWRKYEKHLGPLFEALGPYAPARGG
jgi:tetratricopeptide (TPR) repeat protein